MNKNLYSLLLLIIVLTSCSKSLLVPSEEHIDKTTLTTFNTTIEELKNGQNIYIQKCGNCHYLYRPIRFSEEKWRHEMPEMSVKSKISNDQQTLILKYLLTMREVELSRNKN